MVGRRLRPFDRSGMGRGSFWLPVWLIRAVLYCLAVVAVGVTVWLVLHVLFMVLTVTSGVVVAFLLTAVHLALGAWLGACSPP